MLNAYFNHVRAFENTLVTKYYGLHCVKLNGQKVCCSNDDGSVLDLVVLRRID